MFTAAPGNVQQPRAGAAERPGGLFAGGPQQPTPNTPDAVRAALVGTPDAPQTPNDARRAEQAAKEQLTKLVGVPPGHRDFDRRLASTLQNAGFSPQEIAALRQPGQNGRPGDISLAAARTALENKLAGPLSNENRQLSLASLIQQQQGIHRAQLAASQPGGPGPERPETPRMMAGLAQPRSGFRPLGRG